MDVLLTFIEDDIIEWAHARDGNGIDQPFEFIFDKVEAYSYKTAG